MHVYIYARAACLVPFKIAREPADEGDPDFFPRFELSGIKGRGGRVRVSSIVPRGNFRGIERDVCRDSSFYYSVYL